MSDVASNLYSWSTTASSNSPSDATTIGAGLADNFQEIQKVVRQDLASKGADIASATTTDIGAVAGKQHDITGVTTITSFGTVAAGIEKVLQFDGALTLTHSGNLILPGAVNILTVAGDVGVFVSEGSGVWRCISFVGKNVAGTNGVFSGTLAVTGVATLTAQPILSSLTASQAVFSDASKGLVSNAITGTGNVMMSASPTTTGALTAAAINASGLVAMAGAATVGTTLGVTGTSTMAAINGTAISASGALTGATVTSNGRYTQTLVPAAAEYALKSNGQTTGWIAIDLANTGGNYIFAGENSTGNNLIGGCSAYDLIVRGPSGIAFSANAGAAMQMRLASTGLSVTGTLGVTGSTTLSGATNGIGRAPVATVTAAIASADQTSGTFGLIVYDSVGNAGLTVRGDRLVNIPQNATVGGTLGVTGEATVATGSGNLFVGTAGAIWSGGTGSVDALSTSSHGLTTSATATTSDLGLWHKATSGDNSFIEFGTEGTYAKRGGITYNRGGGVVAYNTSSDYRITAEKGPVNDAVELLSGLRPIWARMVGAEFDIVKLIAHETQAVAPWMVTGAKDAVDDEGRPIIQQVNYGMATPLLVAGWQDHEARLAALQADFQAYKAAHP